MHNGVNTLETRTVQGHPRSKVMVRIGSPLVVSYMTSIDTMEVIQETTNGLPIGTMTFDLG